MPNQLAMPRGDNRTYLLRARDSSGSPVPLSGSSMVWFTVKQALDNDMTDSKAAFTRATVGAVGGGNDQMLITDPMNGLAELYIVPINTQNMGLRNDYPADVQIKLDSGEVYTIWTGSFVLNGDVTRRST